LSDDEGAAIQLLISPAGSTNGKKNRGSWHSKSSRAKIPQMSQLRWAENLKGNRQIHRRIMNEAFGNKKRSTTNLIPPGYEKPINLTPMQQEIVKKFEEKASRADTNLICA
jgi:hypothetical protein